jgi:hypothetical protein
MFCLKFSMEDSSKYVSIDDINKSSNISEGKQNNPNQCPGSVLLNELNYLSWSRVVMIALRGRHKLGYVDGYIKAPDPSSHNY